MKSLLPLYACLVLFTASSCKKEHITTVTTTGATPAIKDSVSFKLNGKVYTGNDIFSEEAGNRQPDLKLDSIDKNNGHYYSGQKDSVLFDRKYSFWVGEGSQNVSFRFIKKYAASQMIKGIGILLPATDADLFKLGSYNYSLDFDRFNTQQGIAIEALTQMDGSLYSYIEAPRPQTTIIKPDAQNGSSFEITSYKTVPGDAIIEARFNATVFNEKELPQKIENGYLRIHIYQIGMSSEKF